MSVSVCVRAWGKKFYWRVKRGCNTTGNGNERRWETDPGGVDVAELPAAGVGRAGVLKGREIQR